MKRSDLNKLLLDFDLTPVRAVRSFDEEHTRMMFRDVPESVKEYARQLVGAGWKFQAVDQTRGHCNSHFKSIVIPVWVISGEHGRCKTADKSKYKTWYIAHEIAHAYDKCKHEHGPEFMQWLIQICPADCVHFELGYKPRNAKAAGIGQVDYSKLLEL